MKVTNSTHQTTRPNLHRAPAHQTVDTTDTYVPSQQWTHPVVGTKLGAVLGALTLGADALLGRSAPTLGPALAVGGTALIGLETGASKRSALEGAALGCASSVLGITLGLPGVALSAAIGAAVGGGLFQD